MSLNDGGVVLNGFVDFNGDSDGNDGNGCMEAEEVTDGNNGREDGEEIFS